MSAIETALTAKNSYLMLTTTYEPGQFAWLPMSWVSAIVEDMRTVFDNHLKYYSKSDYISDQIVDTASRTYERLRHCFKSPCQVDLFCRGLRELSPGANDDKVVEIAESVGKAPNYYSCFISYSSKNQDFAERLHNDLQAKGVRCWFAPEDLKIGDRILDRIDREIRVYDKLMVVLSAHSIDSDWVETEVQAALEKERQRKQTVLFPIRLDNSVWDTERAWAAKLRRERNIEDFSCWKEHDAYQKAFDRLLRDLKAESQEP